MADQLVLKNIKNKYSQFIGRLNNINQDTCAPSFVADRLNNINQDTCAPSFVADRLNNIKFEYSFIRKAEIEIR